MIDFNRLYLAWALLIAISLPTSTTQAAGACSVYMGRVKLNEISIGVSGKSSASNRIELFNNGNIVDSVWKTWQLVVYTRSTKGTITKRGSYSLYSGFTATGQFIYNNAKSIFLRNRRDRYNDIALVDQNGDFIDYVALEGIVQSVPSCFGNSSVVDITANGNSLGNVSRLPDGGIWPLAVDNTLTNTIGRTNVCSNGSDLFVSNTADNTSVLINSTTVTYTVSVSNRSCGNSISGIALANNNIATNNFNNLSSSATQGNLNQGPNALTWTIGTLAAGASATLTITGTPKAIGTLITTANITTPTSGLINTADDTSSHSLEVRDYNYVGFIDSSAQVTEGVDSNFSAWIDSSVVASRPITINYSVSGTANSSDTSLPSSGSVTIDPGSSESPTETAIDFKVLNDSIYESSKTIVLTITSVTSADGSVRLDSGATTLTITLNDDDSPKLIAEYHMDELAWNGSSEEVADTSGYARSGTAGGNSGRANTQSTSPARSGSLGTCGYGYFAGGTSAQSVNMGSTNLGIGGLTGVSVAAWVRWTVIPSSSNGWGVIASNNPVNSADQEQFSLMHNSNNTRFEFALRTVYGRTYVFSTTQPVINQWYHVAGVYNGSQLAIYVNGRLEATVNQSGAIIADANLPLNIGRWGHNSSNYRAFQGNIDEVKIFNGPISSAQVIDTYNETHPCPAYTNGNTPDRFNCVEVNGTPASNLYTKLASSAFNLDVVAVKADGSVETDYVGSTNKNVTVELVDGNGSDCASRSRLGALSKTVSFATSNNGRKTVTFGPTNYAYPNVRCRVTDANQNPSVQRCSSDNFSIRPSSFTIDSSVNADAAGSSSTATPAIKTNAAFSMTATSDALGYNGTPKLDSGKVSAHSGALQNGIVAGTFNAASSATGIASGSSFSYSEVGYFRLAAQGVYDDTFTAIDSASGDCSDDFSNSLVGGEYGCKFGNISATSYFGRFIPDHLTAQLLSNGSFAHACGSFSYNGQAIGYAAGNHPMLGITAYNAASPAAITQNYTGGFARLQANQVTLTAPTSDALKKGADNTNLLRLTATMDTVARSLTDNRDGSLTLILGDDKFTYTRDSNALIDKFSNSIAIPVTTITDSDGVVATNLPVTLQPSGEEIRYGRVNLMNANGSELADLAMAMNAEYFNGSSFISNAIDQCSTATLSIADPISTDSLVPASTCIWDNGSLSGSNKCATSGPSGESYRQGATLASGSFNLWLKAPNQTGSLTVNASVADWLKYNWLGGGQINPSATATFGIFKGKDQLIYFREVY